MAKHRAERAKRTHTRAVEIISAALVACLLSAATRTPVESVTPTPRPDSASFTVVAANIRSFPTMRRYAYRHDMARLTRIKGAKAVLGAEIHEPNGELYYWRRDWRRAGYVVKHPDVEVAQALDPRRFRIVSSHMRLLHGKVAGPVSPARWFVLTKARVRGFNVAVISLHLTNGCWAGQRARWFYSARCEALAVEIRRVRDRVAQLHADGWTVVVGGDMNKHQRIDWSPEPGEVAIQPVSLMQIAVVPAAGVTAHLYAGRVIRCREHGGTLFTDHDVPATGVALSARGR